MTKKSIMDLRNAKVTKANDLIQKSRFNLSLQQQKIVLYLISQISPADDDLKTYSFSIPEFWRVCGIDDQSGKNHMALKAALKEIRDKSLWVTLPDGRETTLAWIEKASIISKSGVVKVKLDEDMKPYLLQLRGSFTSYELVYTLHFKSKYTIRLYELIKSLHFRDLDEYTTRIYSVDELRRLLDAEHYAEYRDFKRKALVPAINEINEFSDKTVSYDEAEKQGRKVLGIKFRIGTKDVLDRLEVRKKIDQEMGTFDQLSLWDTLQEKLMEVEATGE